MRVSACVSTQQGRSYEKFLLEAVVCFSSVKSYMGNIGNIFRQTPWLMMVIFGGRTILTGKHCLSCKRFYAKQSIIYTQVCICSFYSPGFIIFCFFSQLQRQQTFPNNDKNNKYLDPDPINMTLSTCAAVVLHYPPSFLVLMFWGISAGMYSIQIGLLVHGISLSYTLSE